MEVDLIHQSITWRIYLDEKKPQTIQKLDYLPKKLRNKPLMLHITMKNNADLVDIVTD